ncbi:ABC transporter permease [Roseivirga sp. E12]|uniref:ABC transporter permease n=1 Tax=Roseivirga sp. E12 TaxID=2819237 RepID=UPI001ABC4F4B|nr:ABC transporter permease [Roseivirga sp. E12]MBO3697149.1 ABC transporter permease [Roseivirga sp. E12]
MYKNYIKTTLRSLKKNRLFSLINIFGLAAGIAASVFILQYAFFELNFDRFHKNSSNVYRVMNERFEGERLIQRGQITYSAVGKQMFEDYPEVVDYFTLSTFGQNVIEHNQNPVKIPFSILVEPSFFEMFSFNVIAGNPKEVFDQKRKMVVSEDVAKRLFQSDEGNWDKYIGEIIRMGSSRMEYELVGILEDAPPNSSLQYEVILSRATTFDFSPQAEFGWLGSDYFHYVQLDERADPASLVQKFEDFSNKYFKGNQVTGTYEKFHLQPLEDVYLYSDYEYENHQTSDGSMVWILILIAAFILIMAWINYINLTTSKSLQRAKEVGVRKVVGATKKQLVIQFLMESLTLNFLAFILAITLVQVFQNSFNLLVERELGLIDFLSSQLYGTPVFLWLFGTLLLGSFLSGVYPAFILAAFNPSQSLKGQFAKSSKGQLLRKTLVVFQFALSIALIAGTVLVYQQTTFMRNQDLGVNMERVLTVEGPALTNMDTTFVERIQQFSNKLEQNSRIEKVGTSASVLGSRLPRTFNVRTSPEGEGTMLNRINANFGFLDVYKIEIIAGRNFIPSDHHREFSLIKGVILNEKASQLLGFESAQDAVNKKLTFFGRDWEIIGVTADFHHRSLKSSIEPLMVSPFYNGGDDTYHIRIDDSNLPETIEYISQTFDEFFPNDIFEYNFMDARFDNQYKADQQFGKIFNIFSLLAIAIACLGLFGLAGYTAIQKTKEIGIRKVLGASITNILHMLSKEFFLLILLASVIGLPLIFLGARLWLAGYEYQTDIGTAFFLLPVMVVLFVAATIIFGQSMKTAQSNPVKSLRQD